VDLLARSALRALLLGLACAGAAPALAQLSPGPLSSAHGELEGLKRCTACHEMGEGVRADKCLDCHRQLGARIAAGKGLHAGSDYADCIRCHSEHHGRDFALVRWPGGETNFDHAAAGYALNGAHARLACRDCHRESLQQNVPALRAEGGDPARSFLGLGTSCLDCHQDPHRGELGARCLACHGEDAWRPASGFEHATTRYPLRGQHAEVACEKCHPRSGAAATGDLRIAFKGVAFADCRDCHQDPHAGRFKESCASCHTESGWRQGASARFDHERTRYPLRGRHIALDCAACHKPGAPHAPLAHARCLDCHADKHEGQFKLAGKLRDCSDCHDAGIKGWLPASFGLAQHAQCRYPLAGAHLAVACRDCHAPTASFAAGRFRFQDTSCVTCHADPHGKAMALAGEARRCEACHQVASWRTVAWDHAQTAFPLAERHAEVTCRACHAPIAGQAPGVLRFAGLGKDCTACHADVHQGQFVPTGETAARCERCHDSRDWFAARFDHNRDARFALDGAHAPLACTACHAPLPAAAGQAVTLHYKPLPTDCRSCHPDIVTTQSTQGGRP